MAAAAPKRRKRGEGVATAALDGREHEKPERPPDEVKKTYMFFSQGVVSLLFSLRG